MNQKQVKKIINEKIDMKYATEWANSSEQLLEFDYGFNSDHLGIQMSENEDLFDWALNLFERKCEALIAKA